MEKEQILSTLNEQLGQTSLSQRTISDYVDNNLPAEGAEFDFERHAKILKSLNGNFSADVAKQVEDFKKNYKPSDSTTETPKGSGDPDLLKRIEQLEGRLAESAKNATANNLRSEVTAKGKSLKVANEAIWEDAVKAVQIGTTTPPKMLPPKPKRSMKDCSNAITATERHPTEAPAGKAQAKRRKKKRQTAGRDLSRRCAEAENCQRKKISNN